MRKTENGFFLRGLAYLCPCACFSSFQAQVSIKRLEEFLDLEELDPDSVQRKSRKNEEILNPAVGISRLTLILSVRSVSLNQNVVLVTVSYSYDLGKCCCMRRR